MSGFDLTQPMKTDGLKLILGSALVACFDHDVVRRLAACWNACTGVRTEDLEEVGVHFGDAYMKAAALAHTMTEERDELKTRLDVVEAAAREALEWLKDPAMRDRMPAPLVDNLLGALGGKA